MIVKINEKIRVRKSDPNIILEQVRELKEPNKDGETVAWENLGYYSNWEQVFHKALWKVAEGKDVDDIQSFVDALYEAKDEIVQAIKYVGLEE